MGERRTSLRDTHIEPVGQGPSMLVLHGGPGFNHRYLVPHMRFLAAEKSLIFFDQHRPLQGEPVPDRQTYETLCHRTAILLREYAIDNCIQVLVHSFGLAVLLGALVQTPEIKIDGILVNPVPTIRPTFDAMRAALFSRMPAELISGIEQAPLTEWARDDVQTMLSFYISNGSKPDLNELSFDFGLYSRVYDTLGDFDFSDIIPRLQNCDLITGRDDFISEKMICDLIAVCRSHHIIDKAAHFPFAERPSDFRSAVFECSSVISS